MAMTAPVMVVNLIRTISTDQALIISQEKISSRPRIRVEEFPRAFRIYITNIGHSIQAVDIEGLDEVFLLHPAYYVKGSGDMHVMNRFNFSD